MLDMCVFRVIMSYVIGSDKGCAEDMLRLKWASKDPEQLDFVLDTESIYGDKFRYTYSRNHQVKLD